MKESQNIEWKESWRDEYIKWICGFANAYGGTLVIGKNDKGVVTGVGNIKKLLADIPNKVRDILGIIVDVNLKTDKGKNFLEIMVEPYPYPVSYKGEYHYRTGSTKQELKGAALDKFLMAKQGKKWDGVPVPYVGIDDLDSRAFELFREKAAKKKRIEVGIIDEDDNGLIEKLHLIDGDYLKRAAILLFHSDPEKYITGSYIKIGYFKTDSELIYQDRIAGNIIEQVDKCIDLIFTKYLKAYISYDGIQRVESFPVSQLAFREALINAVVHKDYGELTPIQISVYDDKLLIWNVGELPEDWTVETLKQKHSSKPYNPAIANVFFITGFIESWGRGIEKIIKESESFNKITPNFRFDNGLWVEFNYNKVGNRVGNRVGKNLSYNQMTILENMITDPKISAKKLSDIIGISMRKTEKNIAKLKEMQIIERVGGTRGHWEVQSEAKK